MQYTIKEVAKKVDLASHTLRYYENEGLLPFIERDSYGNRVFNDSNIEWLKFVRCLRDTGMSIKEMRHFVDLSMKGDHTVPERIGILYDHKEDLQRKLEEMAVYLTNINHKINYYESLNINVDESV